MSKEKVKMEKVNHYETAKGGLVIVYRVTSGGLLDDFYLVTFDDLNSEAVWGTGPTPEAALECAAIQWDRYDNPDNPFKEVLTNLHLQK